MPIAATSQSVAAVVRPRTEKPCRMIAPAPRKPIPVTICAAIRVGSARTTLWPDVRNAWKPYADTIVNSADPTDTSMCVRSPAWRSRSSRSMPIAPPSTAASTRRSRASSQFRDGMSCAYSSNGFFLQRHDLLDPDGGQLEQFVQARARERSAFRGRLNLDECAVAGHNDVHVDVRLRVLGVVEIKQRFAVDDADGHGGDRAGQRLPEPEPVERTPRRDICAGDRRAPRPAVRLQDVAVDPERALAKCLEVRHRSQ